MKKAFTLIELLVVVLIIGILSAIALPQYQVAVQKAKLVRLMPLVDALYKAEDTYYLANGTYTTDLSVLDLEVGSGCKFNTNSYDCGDYKIGVWDGPSNAQVILKKDGKSDLAYLYYFADRDSVNAKKGYRSCLAKGRINRQICLSLGNVQARTDSSWWDYGYFVN